MGHKDSTAMKLLLQNLSLHHTTKIIIVSLEEICNHFLYWQIRVQFLLVINLPKNKDSNKNLNDEMKSFG